MQSDANGRGIQIAVWLGVPTTVNLSVGSAAVQLSQRSFYRLWSSVDSFFQIGNGTVAASTSSHPLRAGLDVLILTDNTNYWIAGVVATGTGVLYISQLDPVTPT